MLSTGITSAAYIAAAVLFILSLGGLSNQESAKRAVWYGIVGMALAMFATVFGPGVGNYILIILHTFLTLQLIQFYNVIRLIYVALPQQKL